MSARSESSELGVDPEQVERWLAPGDPGSQTASHSQENHQAGDAAQVIDVREAYEREAGHIEGTRHIEFASLTAAAATIDRELPVVFYCRVGSRSDVAAQAFRGAGYEAYSMRGGLARWVQEDRPLSPADGYVANH
jgi:rhodanese-related sulfurtransferase